jgi:RNA polymerase-associated protein LEO1
MASNRDLFGDDDSDDDENNDEDKDVVMADASTAVTVVPALKTTETLLDDDNDKGDQSKLNTTMDKKEDDEEDDDDDDDDDAPQFDDQDVVGTKNTQPQRVHTHTSDAELRTNDDEEFTTNQTSTAPKVIPTHPALVLPDTFSKFPSDVRNVDTVKYFTKLPNLMGIQTMGFSEDTYAPDMEEELYQQAAYNLIRWRYKIDPVTKQPMRQKKQTKENQESKEEIEHDDDNDDGSSLIRESNTRLVEWEDGSHTLHIGSECFHVDFVDSSIQTTNPKNPNTTTSFPGLNGYLYLSQNATYETPTTTNGDENDNDNHPVMIPKTTKETILQSMGSIQQRMILRPSSLQSEAHKSLTVGIRQKTIKKARIAEVVTQEDPELIKQQKMKLSQDLEKSNLRKRSSGGMYGTNRASGYSGGSSRPRMSKGYLEEDDEDYDTTNLKDMKRRTMNRYEDDDDDEDDDMLDYGDDDDDDDDIAVRNKGRPSRRGAVGSAADTVSTKTTGDGANNKNAKTGQPKKDDDDDDVFGDDDDDEDAIQLKTKSQKKKLHQAVIDDDDDDE